MTYFNKNKELKRGYNAYIDESTNYMGTMMNVGLLVMEDGDTYTYESADREVAICFSRARSPMNTPARPLRPTAPTASITKPTACWLPRAPRSP